MADQKVRAARGAIRVAEDASGSVLSATERLLAAMLERNGVAGGDIVSVFFTATDDLRSAFPAEAARKMGLGDVPLLCAREIRSRARCRGWSGSSCTSTRIVRRTGWRTRTSTGRSPCAMTSGERVAVVGTGLIGTSIAMAARAAGEEVRGFDADPDVLARAAERAGL